MKLIQELIAQDKAAREAYQQLVEQQNNFDAFIALEREKLLQFYTSKLQAEIAETKTDIENKLKDKTAQVVAEFNAAMAQIQEEFKAHHDEWLTTIVEDCIAK